MNPLVAMKKGTAMKDKRKRAAGGGGGGGFGPFRIAPHSSISNPANAAGFSHSGFDVRVFQVSGPPPTIENDQVTGNALGGGSFPNFTYIPVDDAAATASGIAQTPASLIHSSTNQTALLNLRAGIDMMIDFEASVSPPNQHGSIGQVDYGLSAVFDPNGLDGVQIRARRPLPHTVTCKSTSFPTFHLAGGGDFQLRVTGTNPGDVIMYQLTAFVVGGGASIGQSHLMSMETQANLTGGTASIHDSMYFGFMFS